MMAYTMRTKDNATLLLCSGPAVFDCL